MRGTIMVVAALVALPACGGDPAGGTSADAVAIATPTEPVVVAPIAPASAVTDGWIGRWVGVEGLALDIMAGDAPGAYRLRIALPDGTTEHPGVGVGDVIRFTRNGRIETIRHGSGRETGLKWLADKTDCLTIKPGEGFCRG